MRSAGRARGRAAGAVGAGARPVARRAPPRAPRAPPAEGREAPQKLHSEAAAPLQPAARARKGAKPNQRRHSTDAHAQRTGTRQHDIYKAIRDDRTYGTHLCAAGAARRVAGGGTHRPPRGRRVALPAPPGALSFAATLTATRRLACPSPSLNSNRRTPRLIPKGAARPHNAREAPHYGTRHKHAPWCA